MATLKELLADAKAKELDLKNKKTALKTASRFTGTRYDKFRKNPENKSQVAELRAKQDAANKAVEEAEAVFNTAKDLADKAIEEKRLNPNPEDKQRLQDEAARRGEVYQDPEGNQATNVDIGSFTKKIEVAGNYIAELGDDGRKQLAQQLNAVYGLKLPVTGKYSPELKNAYIKALSDNLIRATDFNRNIPFEEFLVVAENEGTYKVAGGGGADRKPFGTVSNPTQAKATINNVITNLLNRDATAKEVKSITKQLMDAQKANPMRIDVSGMTVGGLNAEQFITDIITSGKEYASKKQAKQDIVAEGIQETLNSNGISYKPGQLKVYADRVKNCEDIKVIESEIRNIASLGQPDAIKKLMAAGTDLETIYAPYKRAMATSLGVNAETINLDDPTLRMAIGPDKEMSLYEYKKAIRQDKRWQYSQEANDEVTNMINQVKRDFGFMG
jgi:DNA-binding transcriptional regulator YhcF (GntR family)